MREAGSSRILALDGVRALCIVLVLFAHVPGTGIVPMHPFVHACADLGVRGFFVLSGFLITRLLLREQAGWREALTTFYVRRALRIFPALYALLGCALVLAATGLVALRSNDWLYAATYSMNFRSDRAWSLGHLWSLAVEEQFYLLWPAVLLLATRARATGVLAAALVASPAIRLAVWYLLPSQRELSDQAFPCVADGLATGCLLAFFHHRLERSDRHQRFLDSRAFPLVLLLGCVAVAVPRPWFQLGIAPTLANVVIAAAIHRCVVRPASATTRALATPPLVRLGQLSYSLYLWQQIFINRHATAWFHRFPANVLLATLAAAASYHLIERPFLSLTRRFRPAEAVA